MGILDLAEWRDLVDLVIAQTDSDAIQWTEREDVPSTAKGYSAELPGNRSVRVWGFKTGYSYELRVVNASEFDIFDPLRVKRKADAPGLQLKELLTAASSNVIRMQERQKATVRDAILAYTSAWLAGEPIDLGTNWDDIEVPVAFTDEQWSQLIAELLTATERGQIEWARDEIAGLKTSIGDLFEVSIEADKQVFWLFFNILDGAVAADLADCCFYKDSSEWLTLDRIYGLKGLPSQEVEKSFDEIATKATYSAIMENLRSAGVRDD